jgi:hypothetical protein
MQYTKEVTQNNMLFEGIDGQGFFENTYEEILELANRM